MSRVLVDSSVWIDFLRGAPTAEADELDRLLEEELVCTTGLVMAEIVPAARTRKEFLRLHDYFRALPMLAEPPDMWQLIIDWRFRLMHRGVNGIGMADFIVAAAAKAADVAILSKDRHFELMADVVGLRLAAIR